MRGDADLVRRFYRKTGCMLNAIYPFFKLLYLREQGYDLRRGGFVRLSAEHTPADCYQAICEGVLFNVYQCYRKLLALNALNPMIVLSGGILNSPAWTQMCADIFDHEMQIPENPQPSLWGGGVFAVQKCRGDDAADAMIGSFRVVRPDAARHAVYMEKYRRYLDAYDQTAARI